MSPQQRLRHGAVLARVFHPESLWACALTGLATLVVLATQAPIAVNEGAGWDGWSYLRMAVDPTVDVGAPYHLRIGWPFLPRHLAPFAAPLANFKLVSGVCGVLYGIGTWLLLAALFPRTGRLARGLAWSVLNLSELAPLRMAAWYPTSSDGLANLLFLAVAALVLLDVGRWTRSVGLLLVFFAGTTVRENFVVNAALVVLVLAVVFERERIWLIVSRASLVPVLAAIAGTLLGALLIRSVTGHSLVAGKSEVMLGWFGHFRFASTLQALLALYGLIPLLAVAAMGLPARRLRAAPGLWVFLLLTLPVAIVGGSNTERFLYWYMLVVVLLTLPWVDALVAHRRWVELAAAFVYVALMHRYHVPIHTTAGVALDSGCALPLYLRGGSPHLSHYAWNCGTENHPAFLAVFFGALGLILLARVRVRGGSPPGATASLQDADA